MVKLSNDTLREISVGSVKIVEEDGLLLFLKYTDSQTAAFGPYRKISPCTCTTGIKFDFYTNSKNLALAVATEGKYEIWVDGLLRHYIVAGEGGNLAVGERFEAELSDTLGRKKGEYRVTVYFPSHSVGVIKYLELDEGATVRRSEKKKKLLMLGDSITHGYDAIFPSLSYANTLARELDFDMTNQAIGGEMFRLRILPEESSLSPDYITVAYGTNDWSWSGKTLEECVEKEKAFFTKLKGLYPDAKIFYISPLYRGDNHRITTLGDFRGAVKAFSDVAREYGAEVIDGVKLIPHSPLMFEDKYLHPNDLGFTQYANALLKELALLGLKR